jgi:hypothetical protein
MTNEERINRIYELLEEIHNLSPELLYEQYVPNSTKLSELIEKNESLYQELWSLKIKYAVQYEAKIGIDGVLVNHLFTEVLMFATDYQIDTTIKGKEINTYNDIEFSELVEEIFDYLSTKFISPSVLNIKRL